MTIIITWYGHAAVGLEIDGRKVLIDPCFSDNPAAATTADKAAADYILVSHGHGDHLGDAVAIARRTGATIISNSEICRWLRRQGVKTHAQHIGGGYRHPIGYIKLTPALHGSALPDGSYGGSPCGFLIAAEGQTIYVAGDTGLFGDMQLIGEEKLDAALLPIGDNYTMGPADALRAVKLLRPRHVIPIHYDTWEVIKQNAQAWAQQVESETTTQAHVLRAGEKFTLA